LSQFKDVWVIAGANLAHRRNSGAGWTTRVPGDRHVSQPLDNLCHTLQGPHVIRMAVDFRIFEQLAFDVTELLSAQLRQPPGTTCTTQAVSPRPTPPGTPVGDDLMRDTDLACTSAGITPCSNR